MAVLVLLNNFMHDFSAAGWIFCTVILWRLLRRPVPHGDGRQAVIDALKTIIFLMRASLAGIVVFGVIRALAYKTYEWNAAAGDAQVTLLMVKHILLAVVFAPGVLYYIRTRRVLKKNE